MTALELIGLGAAIYFTGWAVITLAITIIVRIRRSR